MRLISSLSWVKKGASGTPTKVRLEKDEMKSLFSEMGVKTGGIESDEQETDDDNDEEITKSTDKKYNLDKYDEEDDDLRLEQLNSLACFASNQDDALLTKKDDGEDSDEDDLAIKETDNLIVCGTINKDDSSLDIYVYNEEEAQFYIHHDILLSSMPICLEWLDFKPEESEDSSGSLNPWIEIWDLDIMDSLEPDFVLGDENVKKKLKKNKKMVDPNKKKAKIRGHTDAVLSLSHNSHDQTELASGSADKTILLWDLENLRQKMKIKGHKDRVQSLKFHPTESCALLSGSADKNVMIHDCREKEGDKKIWSFENEIEKVLWNWQDANYFLCSDDEGFIYINDRRNEAKSVCTLKAHESGPAVFSLSMQVPGLLVTADESEIVKVWDIKNNKTIEYIAQKTFKSGSINCVESSPDSGFVFTFGGTKSISPLVWDLRELEEIRERFYSRMGIVEKEEEKSYAIEKEKRVEKRKARALKFKNIKSNSINQNFNNTNNNNNKGTYSAGFKKFKK